MFMPNATTFHPAEKIVLSGHGLDFARDDSVPGILAGSLVETEAGWRPVERLASGMRVATWDGGFSPVVRVERRRLWPAAGAEVIHVPGGALDTCAEFSLLPGQHVFLVSAVAAEVLGAEGALVSASALVGHHGIARRPLLRPAEVLTLHFADDELVYVNSGALIHCAADGAEGRPAAAGSGFFDVLNAEQAEAMLALIAAETLTSAGMGCAA